jgi:hypothetical protein
MRARNIKPGFFQNEDLAALPPLVRILFAGLWCVADRAGRLEYRPKRIKAAVLPYDELDVEDGIRRLCDAGFVRLYAIGSTEFVEVIEFAKHQHPHHREASSLIPAPDKPRASPGRSREKARSSPSDSLIPDSLIPDSGFLEAKDQKQSPASRKRDAGSLPEWLPAEAWIRWDDFRRRGKRWTDDAQRLSLRTLDKLRKRGFDPVAIIDQSIERGWSGLFEIKGDGYAGNGNQGGVAGRVVATVRRNAQAVAGTSR